MLATKPVIADTSAALEPELLDTLFANLSMLASVYHKPPEAFASHVRPAVMQVDTVEAPPPVRVLSCCASLHCLACPRLVEVCQPHAPGNHAGGHRGCAAGCVSLSSPCSLSCLSRFCNGGGCGGSELSMGRRRARRLSLCPQQKRIRHQRPRDESHCCLLDSGCGD